MERNLQAEMHKLILQMNLRDEEDSMLICPLFSDVLNSSAVHLPDSHLVCFFVCSSHFFFLFIYI